MADTTNKTETLPLVTYSESQPMPQKSNESREGQGQSVAIERTQTGEEPTKKQKLSKEPETEETFVGLSEAVETKVETDSQKTVEENQTQTQSFQQTQPQTQISQTPVMPPFLPTPGELFDPNSEMMRQAQQNTIASPHQQSMNQPMAFLPVMSGVNGFPQQMAYMAVPVNVSQLYGGHPLVGMIPVESEEAKNARKRKRKNRLCSMPGCEKNARGRTKFCVRHGGGVRCSVSGCEKGARPHSTLCSAHGGGHRCLYQGCNKGALAKSVYCRRHGKISQKNTSTIQMM